jgi:hypothetical protein
MAEILDFIRGVIKGNTTDMAGLPADIATSTNPVLSLVSKAYTRYTGKDIPLGTNDLREKVFGKEGVEDKNLTETAGTLVSAGGGAKALKAMIVGAVRLGKISPKVEKLTSSAEELIADNMHMSSVFNSTGVYQDKAYEGLKAVISDKSAQLKDITGKKLSDVLDHPVLYKIYPELKHVKMNVSVDNSSKGSYGAREITASGPNNEALRDVILHEVQHAVQGIEGFQRGGNIQQFLDFAPKLLQKSITKGEASSDPSVRDAAERFKKAANTKIKEAQTSYLNLGGEQEARFTQLTKDMNYEQINTVVHKLLKQNQSPQSFDTK